MWVYDDNHNKIEFLPYFKDRSIVSVLSTGDKTLNFSYPLERSKNLKEENYIRTETDEYVIKQTKTKDEYLEVIATLNVEDLEGKAWDKFKTTYMSITDALNLMLEGTGWSVGYCEITKKRTVEGSYKNTWELSQSCIDAYLCELEYDTINKRINVYEKRGSNKGIFAIDGVNIEELEIQSTSYDFYTRLIPIGKDDLNISSINDGKNYIENYQYSKKVKTIYWKDERYTVVRDLYDDAVIKLEEMSQPNKSYSVTIKDLAKFNDKYKSYEFSLGDTIILISKVKNLRLKERIVKYTEYPENPEKNKVELSTVKVSLEDIQKKFKETSATVDNVITTGGEISSSSVEGLSEVKRVVNDLAYDMGNKVDKVKGKTLSSNDFTNELKTKLENIPEGGGSAPIESISVDNKLLPITDKRVNIDLTGKVDKIAGKGLSSNDFTNDAKNAIHTHTNKEILDSIEKEDIEKWNDIASKQFTGEDISFDKGTTSLKSENVQDVILELYEMIIGTNEEE